MPVRWSNKHGHDLQRYSLSTGSTCASLKWLSPSLQRKSNGNKSLSSGENHHMKYSDDEGDVGMHDDMDDLDGGTSHPLLHPSAATFPQSNCATQPTQFI